MRTPEEGLAKPVPGDIWRGPTVKCQVLEVRHKLEGEDVIVIAACHRDHEIKPDYSCEKKLSQFRNFVTSPIVEFLPAEEQ